LQNWIAEAGFRDVGVRHYRIPIGIWPKDRHYVSRVSKAPSDPQY
jgi:hypothetical protein